jgi:hypothetical protein
MAIPARLPVPEPRCYMLAGDTGVNNADAMGGISIGSKPDRT